MSDDERKPPASVVTDLRVAHLTKAVTRKGEIRFELHVPDNDSAAELAEDLGHAFYVRGMPYVPAREGPISVDEHEQDASRITVVYRPHGKRDLDEDMRCIVRNFAETEVPITDVVEKGIQQAFAALKELNAQGHAAAEAARRSAKTRPGGRERR